MPVATWGPSSQYYKKPGWSVGAGGKLTRGAYGEVAGDGSAAPAPAPTNTNPFDNAGQRPGGTQQPGLNSSFSGGQQPIGAGELRFAEEGIHEAGLPTHDQKVERRHQ